MESVFCLAEEVAKASRGGEISPYDVPLGLEDVFPLSALPDSKKKYVTLLQWCVTVHFIHWLLIASESELSWVRPNAPSGLLYPA